MHFGLRFFVPLCNVFPLSKGFAFCVTAFGFSKNSCTPLYYNKNRQ